MSTALATRPQQGHNRRDVGASTYTATGLLRVKTDDGRWVTFPRLVAERYAAKCGVTLPNAGIRIEQTDPGDVRAATLTVKVRGGTRHTLPAWVRESKRNAA